MSLRRASNGDSQKAKPLLEYARDQFRLTGMNGWQTRAEATLTQAN